MFFYSTQKIASQIIRIRVHWYFYVPVRPYALIFFVLSLFLFFDHFKDVSIIIRKCAQNIDRNPRTHESAGVFKYVFKSGGEGKREVNGDGGRWREVE